MGGNISFEWGLCGLNRDGDFPIIVSEDVDTFWDEVMVEVCRWKLFYQSGFRLQQRDPLQI